MRVDKLPVRVEATRYEVTNYPEQGVNAREFTLWVERRDIDRWCVTDGFGSCYRKDGHKSYERNPSSRTDRFKNAYRFPLDEALALAQKLVPKMRLGKGPNRPGQTAEEIWEWEQGRRD